MRKHRSAKTTLWVFDSLQISKHSTHGSLSSTRVTHALYAALQRSSIPGSCLYFGTDATALDSAIGTTTSTLVQALNIITWQNSAAADRISEDGGEERSAAR